VYPAVVLPSDATDVLSVRWGLREALGSLVLPVIATNLPQIAITTCVLSSVERTSYP
jgi:hypothetical protein